MTNLLKHTWTTSVKNDSGGTVISDSQAITGNEEVNVKDVAAASTTKHILVGSITKANLVSFAIESDQNVTLKINSSSTPDQTITLTAKRGYAWNNLQAVSNPLTPTTITDLYFVNAGATDANITAGFLSSQ